MKATLQSGQQDFVRWFLSQRESENSQEHYHEEAILVAKPGDLVSGKNQINNALNQSLNHSHSCGDNIIIENGDIALVMSKVYPNNPGTISTAFVEAQKAIHVFKKDPQGNWQCVVDNMFGTDLLDYI